MRQSRNNSLQNLVEELSEVFLESEEQEKNLTYKSEHNNLYHVYQKQALQNSIDIDILKE